MRKRLRIDNNWRFSLGHATDRGRDFEFTRSRCLVKAGEARGAAGVGFDDSGWQTVDVPHDWAMGLPLDKNGDKELCEHGFRAVGPDHPEHSVGWYRRVFAIPKSDLGRRISVEFDGVFRDSIVWINGHRLGRHESGYTGFRYDVTDFVNYGGGDDGKNVLAVRVDVSSWEGWWYEGAGIYRHAWLVKTDPMHVAPGGVFVTTELGKATATITVQAKIVNEGERATKCDVSYAIVGPGGTIAAKAKLRGVGVECGGEVKLRQAMVVRKPALWTCDEPNLYQLRVAVGKADEVTVPFGIRTLRWDAKRGFFLNGKALKIQGTCNHQHFGGLGIALPDRIHQLRVEKLKELGANAYRCSHYAVAPELLDECDRQGMLVVAENRLAGSSPAVLAEFENMIVRDRNHPSIILWSIANEEHSIQWKISGERMGRTMVKLAHRLDPTRAVTAAMHDRGLNEGFANVVDVHGWNYLKMGDVEAFHRRRPKQPIVGTEEGSTVCTRGVYADDAERGYVSGYDIRSPKWGCTAEHWWSFFQARAWLAGGFVWTGFDYYGEPIPYQWPCTASHFGLMDLCGFPKDNYYYYQAWWSKRTVLHLLPHWNWAGNEGEVIDVRCFGNCPEVELFLNGRSHGRKPMPRNSHLAWPVAYEAGKLEAIGYEGGKAIACARRETAGAAVKVVLAADRRHIRADGEDVVTVSASAVDAEGRAVPTAGNEIRFEVGSGARLLGVCNGDPSSHELSNARGVRLFNGQSLAVIQAGRRAGVVRVEAHSAGLEAANVEIRLIAAKPRDYLE